MNAEEMTHFEFFRSFDKGGKAPWVTFCMRNDLDQVREVHVSCSKCKAKETLSVEENTDCGKLFEAIEIKHEKCGLC